MNVIIPKTLKNRIANAAKSFNTTPTKIVSLILGLCLKNFPDSIIVPKVNHEEELENIHLMVKWTIKCDLEKFAKSYDITSKLAFTILISEGLNYIEKELKNKKIDLDT